VHLVGAIIWKWLYRNGSNYICYN